MAKRDEFLDHGELTGLSDRDWMERFMPAEADHIIGQAVSLAEQHEGAFYDAERAERDVHYLPTGSASFPAATLQQNQSD